jgi:hypothetical protein
MSQYLSMIVTPPPKLNKASWVAKLPQLAQNFVLPVWLSATKGLSDVKIFSVLIILFSPHEGQQSSKGGLLFIIWYFYHTNKNVRNCHGVLPSNTLTTYRSFTEDVWANFGNITTWTTKDRYRESTSISCNSRSVMLITSIVNPS